MREPNGDIAVIFSAMGVALGLVIAVLLYGMCNPSPPKPGYVLAVERIEAKAAKMKVGQVYRTSDPSEVNHLMARRERWRWVGMEGGKWPRHSFRMMKR